jgi:hypothetical protein
MDPISLIVAALAAGASTALKDTASQAIKDAYGGLKSLLERRLGDQPLAGELVEKHEEAPDVWEAPLRDQLAKAGVATDAEAIRSAQDLLARVDPDGAAKGKYNVSISGGKGIVVGDHARVEMTFEDGD